MEQCDVNKTLDGAMHDKYSTVSWTVVVIFCPLVATFGIFFNCAFIYVVYRVKSMRTITNIYLVNLAIADSLLLAVAFAKYIGTYANSPVYDTNERMMGFAFNNVFECVTLDFLVYLCYYESLWTITLVSVERYFGICHSLWHMSMRSTRRNMCFVIASWLISALFASPTVPRMMVKIVCLISPDRSEIIERIPNCVRNCENCSIVVYATDVIQFVIAFIINTALYSLIIRKVTRAKIPNDDIEMRNRSIEALHKAVHSKRYHSVAKMLVLNGIVFFICLMPFSIHNVDSLAYYFGWFKLGDVMQTVSWIGRFLYLLNSALNPLIYNATNHRYRLAFKQALCLSR